MNVEFKVADKLRYKGGYSDYEFGGEYEIAHVESLPLGEVVYYIDNGVEEDMWYADELHEHFDVIDEPQQPQVTKVKLTQEQVEALEGLKHGVYNNSELIFKHATQEYNARLRSLGALSIEKFSTALLIGYEVEQTAEEKVLKRWRKSVSTFNAALMEDGLGATTAFENGYQNGVKDVLSAYNITVKGINDND